MIGCSQYRLWCGDPFLSTCKNRANVFINVVIIFIPDSYMIYTGQLQDLFRQLYLNYFTKFIRIMN